MSGQAHAFWVTGPGTGAILPEPLAEPRPGEVTVRACWSGISRGTESLVFAGRVPPSEWERMRAPFQAGAFPAPVKYGYASVGLVEAGPAELLGRHVFVLFPHQTRYHVPASAVRVVPDNVPPSRAVLAANLETAVNGIWDAAVQPGDRVTVIGGGTVGCLVTWLAARIPGCEVTLVDVNPARAGIADSLGAAFATPETAIEGADIVIHASGHPAGLALGLRLAGLEARVVEMSWYGDTPVPLALGGAFHARRLSILSSQVGRLPATHQARWDYDRRMQLALRLLQEPALEALITGEDDFDALPAVMARLTAAPGNALCHRIRYSQD